MFNKRVSEENFENLSITRSILLHCKDILYLYNSLKLIFIIAIIAQVSDVACGPLVWLRVEGGERGYKTQNHMKMTNSQQQQN